MDIRKISIGPDYKSGAIHYIVGQKVLGDSNEIHLIKRVLWKEFNQTIPTSIEFNIDF